tara:strand:+ start:2226 stop:3329 length:1104 start_codon:yes stop_codon:yes gene_type:complete
MKISFLDLKKQINDIDKKIINSIKKNIKNSSFIGGKDLIDFQINFSKYLNVRYCLGVANGTDALEIAIKTLNLKKDSEVIVPANTWISTAEAVLSNHLKVKFVDIDKTHNICIKDLKKKISRKTSAIIVVHLFGNPANISQIKKISKSMSIKLIEDCAQSHGAEYHEKKTGCFGDISTFSFFPSKNLGCFGDGGCIVTNKKELFIQAKKIANHGGLKKNQHLILGRNSRLDNIQAGILRIKLTQLDKWIKIRKIQSDIYKKKLKNVGDIEFVKTLHNSKSSNHLFVIKTKKRNSLKIFLEKNKVSTGIHYPFALPETPIFKKKHFLLCRKMKAVIWSKRIISLPIGEHLNYQKINKVCSIIKSFFDA